MPAALDVDPLSSLWATCPGHRSSRCAVCPRCFHGRFRCRWCWPNKTGTPSAVRRHRLRCASCGRFKALRVRTPECDRCTVAGFVALTLF